MVCLGDYKMAQRRECIVNYGHEKKNGFFHGFGQGIKHDSMDNAFANTYAIVELEGGNLVEVDIHMVTFID